MHSLSSCVEETVLANVASNALSQIVGFIGLEEYTEEHMKVLNPSSLGFKGSYANAADATSFEGKETIQQFFKPHNERLGELLKDHAIPWHPFPVQV